MSKSHPQPNGETSPCLVRAVAAIETAFGQRASVLNCSDFVLTFRIKISGILRPKPIIKCSHFYRELLTTNQGVDAKIIMTEGKPEAIAPPREPAIVLTPKSGAKPRINGAKVFGARPGAPFLFTIAARAPNRALRKSGPRTSKTARKPSACSIAGKTKSL